MASNGQIPIAIGSLGDNTIVTAENARQTISVVGGYLTLDTATTVQIKSGTNAITGPTLMSRLFLDKVDSAPWYITNPGENLVIALGSSVGCNGIFYITRT